MKFTVDRSKWVNGSNYRLVGGSFLLNSQGYMCCLGFVAKQATNCRDSTILKVIRPDMIKPTSKTFLKRIKDIFYSVCKNNYLEEQDWIGLAMAVNDNPVIDNEERERLLIDIFKYEGYELTFFGQYN